MSYQPGIPTGLVNLDEDYQNIQGNFQALDTVFAVDHVQFSNATAQKGYHTLIHFNPVSTTVTNAPNNQPVSIPPAVTAGYGQLFSAQINDGLATDEVLYWRSGNGRLTQLIRNTQPVASANGYTFLPGGLLIQWGNFNPNSSINVTFPIAFPSAVYNIQLTGSASNNSTFRNGVSTGTLTTTGFTWEGTLSSNWKPIYWLAIGN